MGPKPDRHRNANFELFDNRIVVRANSLTMNRGWISTGATTRTRTTDSARTSYPHHAMPAAANPPEFDYRNVPSVYTLAPRACPGLGDIDSFNVRAPLGAC